MSHIESLLVSVAALNPESPYYKEICFEKEEYRVENKFPLTLLIYRVMWRNFRFQPPDAGDEKELAASKRVIPSNFKIFVQWRENVTVTLPCRLGTSDSELPLVIE